RAGLRVAELLTQRRDEIIDRWIKERLESDDFRDELISKKELRQQSREIVEMLARSIKASNGGDFNDPAFDDLRSFLNEISRL
ncbi:RsbRD N-terminal domain-containing protein, partial [Acinetobacter baumannii]